MNQVKMPFGFLHNLASMGKQAQSFGFATGVYTT